MADTIFGRNLPEARRVFKASITSFPVNGSSTIIPLCMPSGGGKFRVESVQWVASAVLNDADGTMLVSVIARDISEAADDTLVNAQSVEGGTANQTAAFTLASESSEKEFTLEEGDSVRVTFTNNTAAIDTNGAITVFIIGYPLPLPYDPSAGVKYESQY
jgi:hypothetical protein